ncbi:response regulator [Sphingomonas lenta]|uniref:Response regulator n=1 Tax=Sphingomonas lenta TaxID=1141887 RepID=A0A2A2SIN0_9SPHN|nr:response regulator [Sphingomonas lenta]PAX09096.1 response regulator [Sphingomonas lenta]
MNDTAQTPPTVLVVDDEPIIRLDAVAIVEDAGFLALEAADAEEALEMMSAHPDISVLFTDINMPGPLDGLQLARRVHENWPAVHLVITSGRVDPDPDQIPDHGHFVAKPYQPAAVVALLRSLCSRSGSLRRLP